MQVPEWVHYVAQFEKGLNLPHFLTKLLPQFVEWSLLSYTVKFYLNAAPAKSDWDFICLTSTTHFDTVSTHEGYILLWKQKTGSLTLIGFMTRIIEYLWDIYFSCFNIWRILYPRLLSFHGLKCQLALGSWRPSPSHSLYPTSLRFNVGSILVTTAFTDLG